MTGPTPTPNLWHSQHFIVVACSLVLFFLRVSNLQTGQLSLRRTKEPELWLRASVLQLGNRTGASEGKRRYPGQVSLGTDNLTRVYPVSLLGRKGRVQSGIESVDDGEIWVTWKAGPALGLVVLVTHNSGWDSGHTGGSGHLGFLLQRSKVCVF